MVEYLWNIIQMQKNTGCAALTARTLQWDSSAFLQRILPGPVAQIVFGIRLSFNVVLKKHASLDRVNDWGKM